MNHGVMALGAALLCVSGSVWSVPALTDLRAGADRPLSRRLAAGACLAVWGTAALAVPLMLAAVPWSVMGAVVAAGVAAAAALAARARVERGVEKREVLRHWAALSDDVPVHRRPPPPERAFMIWLSPGFVLAPTAAAAVLLTGDTVDRARTVTAAATALAIASTCLIVASVRAHALRRRMD